MSNTCRQITVLEAEIKGIDARRVLLTGEVYRSAKPMAWPTQRELQRTIQIQLPVTVLAQPPAESSDGQLHAPEERRA